MRNIFQGLALPRFSQRQFSLTSLNLASKMTPEQLKARQAAVMAKSLPTKRTIPGVGNVILVASGKGGVGKSTTAVNLSLALSRLKKGLSVGLLDADVFGPSVPVMMNVSGQPAVSENNKMLPLNNFGIKIMSMGLLVDESDAVVWRGPMVMGAVEKMIHQTEWAPLDILVIDMPPGTGDIHLSIAQTLQVAGAIVVSTPQKVALADARKGVSMFEKVNIPVFGIVQNMSSFICGDCGSITHVFGQDGALKLAQDLGVPLLGDIPLDPKVMTTCDTGKPIILSSPQSPVSKTYKEIAQKVFSELNPP